MNYIKLGKKIISNSSSPYIIAEIGVNHEGSISSAKKLILNAKKGGADAAKFQTYKAHLITSKYAPSYWDTNKEKIKNQFELFQKYDKFEEKQYSELYRYCKKINIEFISTPFDHKSVDMLDKYVNFFKVSSSDITNFPLLKKISTKKKPILISTGASSLKEIEEAITYLNKKKCKNIAIMHCILNYPTKDQDANLNMIKSLKKNFPNNIIGYSDHTLPCSEMKVVTTAYILGAKIIEKHFTINKKLQGNDHYHSMDLNDLKNLRKRIKNIDITIGNSEKKYLSSEIKSRKFARRSVIAKNFIEKNKIIKKTDLICKRPGTGINPKYFNKVIGRRAAKDLKIDHIIKLKDIK